MTLLTKAEFARECGVQRQAIAWNLKHGKLVETTTGHIDTESPEARVYLAKRKTRPLKNTTPIKYRKESTKKRGKKTDGNGRYDEDLIDLDIEEANRLEKIEKVMKLRVETAAKRGELVSRESMHEVFAKFYAVHTGQLHPLGDKVAQDVCAVFGDPDETKAAQVREVIDKQVFQALQHIQRLMDDFYRTVKDK
jgi:hypothetical protein